MTATPKWRKMDVGDVWHPHEIERVRVHGWCLDVAEGGKSYRWYFTGNHKDGRVTNSLWAKSRYATAEEAKAAAIAFAENNR